MLSEETCTGCKTSYFSIFKDIRPTEIIETKEHCCSFLYKELVNQKLPDTHCPCEECIVKPMCVWSSKRCCSLFSVFCETIPFDCIKTSSTTSSSYPSSSYRYTIKEKIKTIKYDGFYDKRTKDAIFKDSKFKIKNRKYL